MNLSSPRLYLSALLMITALTVNAGTFELNPAQELVFDTNHLDRVQAGSVLTYKFTIRRPRDTVEDTVTATIDQVRGNGKKDITVGFLTGERKVAFPPFHNFNGNPVVMTTLERDVREMSRLTGGSSLYFRNRVRDAFGRDPDVRPVTISVSGKDIEAREIIMQPFLNDQFIERFPAYQRKTYRLIFSDQVPGMVASISIEVPSQNNGDYSLVEELRFSGYTENE